MHHHWRHSWHHAWLHHHSMHSWLHHSWLHHTWLHHTWHHATHHATHHLLLLHLHLSLSHHRRLLLLSVKLSRHILLFVLHRRWNHTGCLHLSHRLWSNSTGHLGLHHRLVHGRLRLLAHSHPVGQLLLLNHHHVLVPLHHHLLLLLNGLHVGQVHASHHLLLLHLHHVSSWVELSCVRCLSSQVLLGVLLHLLESPLLRYDALLSLQLLHLQVISFLLCLLDLEFNHSELALFDSKRVLFVIVR
jgi:hypothetical protein